MKTGKTESERRPGKRLGRRLEGLGYEYEESGDCWVLHEGDATIFIDFCLDGKAVATATIRLPDELRLVVNSDISDTEELASSAIVYANVVSELKNGIDIQTENEV